MDYLKVKNELEKLRIKTKSYIDDAINKSLKDIEVQK